MVGSKDSSPEGGGSVEWLVGVQSLERPQRRPGLGLLSVCKVGLSLPPVLADSTSMTGGLHLGFFTNT